MGSIGSGETETDPERARAQQGTLQMKGRWESNINVWFPFMYSQKYNVISKTEI